MTLTAIFYVLVFFVGSAAALGGRPLIGLIVYMQTFYLFAPGSWWGSSLPDLRWSLLASLVTLIAVKVKDSKSSDDKELEGSNFVTKPNFLSLPEHKLYLFFVLWIWLQSLWALNLSYHDQYIGIVTKFFILLYLLHKILIDEKSIIIFLVVNAIGCAYFGWYGFTNHRGGRFEGVPTPGLQDGNFLCMHMAPILLFSSYILLCDLTKKKYLLFIPFALIVNGIFMTQSRGAIVGMAAGSLSMLAFRPYRLRKQIYFYIVLASVAAATLMPSVLVDRLSDAAAEEDERDGSAQSRIVIAKAQWEMFKTSPIIGYGHRGTLVLSPDYIDPAYFTNVNGEGARGSHNMFMSLLVDHGLVGTTLFLTIVFIYYKRALLMRKQILRMEHGNLSILYVAGISALLSLLASSMFANSIRLEIHLLLWGMLAAIFCLMRKPSQSHTTLS